MYKSINKKNVYWIRHAESLSNIAESNQKIIDPSLTSLGYSQCEELKKYLQKNQIINTIDLIVVSPLNRTLETCKNIINDNIINSVEIISLDEIRERINHPCHKRHSILKKKLKYKYINFNKIKNNYDDMYNKFNGMEPETNVISRCEWFIKWLKARKEKNILVITHGNFLLPMFSNILNNITNIENKNFFSNCEIRKTII